MKQFRKYQNFYNEIKCDTQLKYVQYAENIEVIGSNEVTKDSKDTR